MWLAIKDLYTDVKAQVLYSGELSGEFDVSQGTGQGKIFAPFAFCKSCLTIAMQFQLIHFHCQPRLCR